MLRDDYAMNATPSLASPSTADYVILALLIIAWCVLHSAMISISATDYLKKRLGSAYRYYRLFFNVFSILTFVPIFLFASSLRTQSIVEWAGVLRIVQVLLIGTSALFFILGGRHYDAAQFLGLRQIKEGTTGQGITESGALNTSGVLGMVRHPWYLATILLIWARQLDVSAMLVNVILTAYLIIGAYLEERKLVMEFGDEYRAYQKRVSMLFPQKWLKSTLRKVLPSA